MTYPKISIITPSYNQGQYIEETILSIINQNYPNLEYIIIDGGSSDETVAVIQKYTSKINYWISEKDEGQTDAINKGFEKATGVIINWVNSDDFLEQGCLFKIAAAFTEDIICVTGWVRNFEENGNYWDEQLKLKDSSLAYITKTYNNQPGTFFRKDFWDKIFPLPKNLHCTMDQYIWFCYWLVSSTSSLRITDTLITHFRRHSQSKTIASQDKVFFKTLSKKFFNEYNAIFINYLMIKQFVRTELLVNYNEEQRSTEFINIYFPDFILENSKISTEQLFHNYYMELLKEDYRIGNINRLKRGFKEISPLELTEENLQSLKNLRHKKFLRLLKLYRKIYWSINQVN